MNNLSLTLILFYGVCGVLAGRRYIAIPIDGVDVIELNPIPPPVSRISRQTEAYVPVPLPVQSSSHQDQLEGQRQGRSAQIFDYVDFGAHTGSNGAFGWYADYPAHH